MRNTQELIDRRRKLLESLGGLSEPIVRNEEWLYLLGEETRNSILIEGYFVSEEEFEKALKAGKPETRNMEVALNYFKTALFVYGLAYENFKSGEFLFSESLIKQINKGVTGEFGDYRRGDIAILRAKISPPSPFHVPDWMRLYVEWVREHFGDGDFTESLAKGHVLFECIHPFPDGNGRTGRIILNYLLLSKGFPPVVIKGDKESREKYIRALQIAEEPLREVIEGRPGKERLEKALGEMDIRLMKEIVGESLIRSLDIILAFTLERKLGIALKPSSEVAKELGYSPDSIRELVRRGYFIAVKRGKTWFTSPELDVRKMEEAPGAVRKARKRHRNNLMGR
ncbi:Fic family protein [Hydrogenivirga sp. 128-5-R1-1]|uniref:Fic family protein n=1 Tax=Hydrogenivirga sp. 128-5-R1-1 TaxID=392423 RepID=UPI00015EF130|nr:Fic family protein [Hydrogenivirga sp. 128-5-R1-1]EDP74676.1 hypothetical protein HG1285_14729 [Hydrogenivirga sp. 128-5-R1-1]